jgi:hypothetical protein
VKTQLAHIYVVNDRLFAVPMSRTDVGVWAALEAPSECALLELDASIGTLVEGALGHSRTDVPHPDRDHVGRLLDPLLRATGIRRSAELHRQAGLVSVERRDRAYRLARHVKVFEKGSNRAWFGEEAISRELADPSPDELGALVRELAIATESLKVEAGAG